MMDRWLPPSRRGVGYEYRAGLTWETLDAIKEITGLPFILKGVATAEDAAGQAGLVRVLEILESEIITTMGLLGIMRLDQVNRAHLCPVQPLGPAHEMSAFPHLPGGRVL